jgi:hypothetical protein
MRRLRRGSSRPGASLLDCPFCEADFMCPMAWNTAGELAWSVTWRCGACGVRTETVISNEQAAHLDLALNRQCAVIRRAADGLEHERMVAEAAAFVRALERGQISAADFA